MNILSYNLYVLCNILIGLVVVVSGVLFKSNNVSALVLVLFGLAIIAFSVLSKNKGFTNAFQIIPEKIVALAHLVLAVLLSFTPYILAFSTNTPLIIAVLVSSFLTLFTLIITNFSYLTNS